MDAEALASWREAYSHLLIAVRDAAVTGFASAGPSRPNESVGAPVRDRELRSLYVRASEYGSGLAHELLTAVLPDDVPAELWVFEAHPRARAFYAKHVELGSQAEVRLVR